MGKARAELSNTTRDLQGQSTPSSVQTMAMNNSTKTKLTGTVRGGRSNLSFGVRVRSVARAIKKYAAPTGIAMLALSTACAPVTSTAHLNNDRPDGSIHRQFVVDITPETLTSDSNVDSKLETLFEGQRLAFEMTEVTVGDEPDQITFNLDLDIAVAIL